MMMDDYKNSDDFQRTEGCKMISPHHSHPTNGVRPSDSMSAAYIPTMAKMFACLTRTDLDEYAKIPDSLPPGSTGQDVFNACHDWLVAKAPDFRENMI